VGAAILWGVVAASSLVIGAVLGLARRWPRELVGLVLGFGAGALISAVSFELFGEGIRLGGAVPVAIGLAVGALTYFFSAGRVASMGGGAALALGAFLDGIPEQMVLGIGLAGGQSVSAGLLAAIFVSNLPEAIGGSTDMKTHMSRKQVTLNWVWIASFCAVATVVGYAVADIASEELQAGINGFAAGALIVMLVDSMVPEATEQAGRKTGLVTTLGFAVAAGLSLASN
jgi:zinc transporter, ZIP family